jgi:hypothetical protein
LKLIVAYYNFAKVPKIGTCTKLIFTYFILEAQNHVIYMGTIKVLEGPNKNPEICNES